MPLRSLPQRLESFLEDTGGLTHGFSPLVIPLPSLTPSGQPFHEDPTVGLTGAVTGGLGNGVEWRPALRARVTGVAPLTPVPQAINIDPQKYIVTARKDEVRHNSSLKP